MFINSKGNICLAESYFESCMKPQWKTATFVANNKNGRDLILVIPADFRIGEELWKK